MVGYISSIQHNAITIKLTEHISEDEHIIVSPTEPMTTPFVIIIKGPALKTDPPSPAGFFMESDHQLLDDLTICIRHPNPPCDSPSKVSCTSKTESEDTNYLEKLINSERSPMTKKHAQMALNERIRAKENILIEHIDLNVTPPARRNDSPLRKRRRS